MGRLRTSFAAALIAILVALAPSVRADMEDVPYRVSRGDTGHRIARRFGMRLPELAALKPDVDLEHLRPGMQLVVGHGFRHTHRVLPGEGVGAIGADALPAGVCCAPSRVEETSRPCRTRRMLRHRRGRMRHRTLPSPYAGRSARGRELSGALPSNIRDASRRVASRRPAAPRRPFVGMRPPARRGGNGFVL